MTEKSTKPAGCSNCAKMEQKYKENPRSVWVRVWKWHSGWCPGYKAHRKATHSGPIVNNQ